MKHGNFKWPIQIFGFRKEKDIFNFQNKSCFLVINYLEEIICMMQNVSPTQYAVMETPTLIFTGRAFNIADLEIKYFSEIVVMPQINWTRLNSAVWGSIQCLLCRYQWTLLRNVKEVELILQIYYFLKRENWYWYLAQFNILELTSFGVKIKTKQKTPKTSYICSWKVLNT